MKCSKEPLPSVYRCVSVINGWQTQCVSTGELIGPAFDRTTDLWEWQKNNLYKELQK